MSIYFYHMATAEIKSINSFVDRDMVMRFYWGLGIGHAYSHQTQTTDVPMKVLMDEAQEDEVEVLDEAEANMEGSCHKDSMDMGDGEDNEDEEDDSGSALGMEDRENEGWMDENSDSDEGDIEEDDEDADFLEKYDMYGL